MTPELPRRMCRHCGRKMTRFHKRKDCELRQAKKPPRKRPFKVRQKLDRPRIRYADNARIRVIVNDAPYNGIIKSRVPVSGFKGVFKPRYARRWRAHIYAYKKLIDLGAYETKEDAIKAYADARLKYFGVENARGPYRPGTHAAKLFEVMRESRTIGEYRAKSARIHLQAMTYLIDALSKRYIAVEI